MNGFGIAGSTGGVVVRAAPGASCTYAPSRLPRCFSGGNGVSSYGKDREQREGRRVISGLIGILGVQVRHLAPAPAWAVEGFPGSEVLR